MRCTLFDDLFLKPSVFLYNKFIQTFYLPFVTTPMLVALLSNVPPRFYARVRRKWGQHWNCFDKMPTRNVISWTAWISGYAQNGKSMAKALEMFSEVGKRERHLNPNEVTLASVLPACAHIGALDMGKRI
ncbi:Pentatricopeptide repeat-containing protein, partial [Cucurbita argyrosperma subsp. sororia]